MKKVLPTVLCTEKENFIQQKAQILAAKAYPQIPAFQAPRLALLGNMIDHVLVVGTYLMTNFFNPALVDTIHMDLVFAHKGVRRRFLKYMDSMGVEYMEANMAYRSLHANVIGVRVFFQMMSSDIDPQIASNVELEAENNRLIMHFTDFISSFIATECPRIPYTNQHKFNYINHYTNYVFADEPVAETTVAAIRKHITAAGVDVEAYEDIALSM